MGSSNNDKHCFTDEVLEQYLLGTCDSVLKQRIEDALARDEQLAQRLEDCQNERALIAASLAGAGDTECSDADLDQIARYLDGSLSEAAIEILEVRLAGEAFLRGALVSMYLDLQILLDEDVEIPEFEVPKAGDVIDYKSMRDNLLEKSERKARRDAEARKALEDSSEDGYFQQGSS